MRDIKAGEELVIDYGMVYKGDYSMKCTCGSEHCRKIITEEDYKLPQVKAYKNYCSAFIWSLQNK